MQASLMYSAQTKTVRSSEEWWLEKLVERQVFYAVCTLSTTYLWVYLKSREGRSPCGPLYKYSKEGMTLIETHFRLV